MLYSRTATSISLASVLYGYLAYGIAQRSRSSMRFDPIIDVKLSESFDKDWPIKRSTYDAHADSSLNRINKSNVSELEEAWRFKLVEGPNMTTPPDRFPKSKAVYALNK